MATKAMNFSNSIVMFVREGEMKVQLMISASLAFVSLSLLAQIPQVAQSGLPPGAIDGAKHPELIPDAVAFRLVFAGLRISAGADSKTMENETAIQSRRLKRMGLSEADKATFRSILVRFDSDLAAWEKETSSELAAGLTIFPSPDIERDSIVQRTRDQLEQQLSHEGFTNFSQYVAEAKQHMVVWP